MQLRPSIIQTAIIFGLITAFGAASLAGLTVGATPAGQDHVQQRRPSGPVSPCDGVMSSTLSTERAADCKYDVALEVGAQCPVCPGGVRAVFIQIGLAPKNGWQNDESVDIWDEIVRLAGDETVVEGGVIEYTSDGVRTIQRMTDEENRVRGSLRGSEEGYDPQAVTIERAAQEAVRMMSRARNNRDDDGEDIEAEPCELYVIFGYTKSHMDDMKQAMMQAAKTLTRDGVLLVGCPQDPGTWYCRVARDMPRTNRNYAEWSDSGRLRSAASVELSQQLRDRLDVTAYHVEQYLPSGLEYLPGSAPTEPDLELLEDGSRLAWSFEDLQGIDDGVTMTYSVKPTALGDYTITGQTRLIDRGRHQRMLPAEPMTLSVTTICPQAPPPSATPTSPPDTATPVPPTPTPTNTPEDTATPTPSVYRVWLPWAAREEEPCVPELQRTDAVLVLDMSTSMARETRGERSKHAAALEAANEFVSMMDLADDHDRVAIVGFNDTAWTEQDLSADRTAVEAAIERLRDNMSHGTRLDLALLEGQAVIDRAQRDADVQPTLILLTDGLPNRVPPHPDTGRQEDTVLEAASAAKDAGTRVFTIGLGLPEDIMAWLLRDAASHEDDFYLAPDGEDLAAIYREIAGRIDECP